MAATYRPAFQGQLVGSCARGSTSCTSFAFAMAGDRSTLGKTVPRGCDVRRATGDTSGGTTLRQNAGALLSRYKIGMVCHFYAGFNDALDSLEEERGVAMQIAYWPVRDYRDENGNHSLRGSESFGGGHAVYLNEHDRIHQRTLVYDPLADGRRSGIAKGPDWWPDSLLRKAAGELVIGSSGTKVGFGRAWFADTKVTAQVAHTTPLVTTDYGRNGLISAIEHFTDSSHVMSLSKGRTVYRSPKGKAVTKMVAASAVPVIGNAEFGWKAVVIETGVPYDDKVRRPSVLYVPGDAGAVTAR